MEPIAVGRCQYPNSFRIEVADRTSSKLISSGPGLLNQQAPGIVSFGDRYCYL
jgi:hypothetical protein